jgi:PAS domain S-box-containing protein
MPDPARHPSLPDDADFRLAMASSGIGMAIADLQGRWVEVNPAFERMFGYPADDVVGRPAAAFTHPDDVAMSQEQLRRLIEGEIPVIDATKRYLHHDGSVIWAHANVGVMRDAQQRPQYLIVQLRDITEQEQAKAALHELNASLEQRVAARAAELQALTRQQEAFAYGVSHDLRAPLRAIDSFAGLLAAREAVMADDTARAYLERIRGAAARMGGLIDSLLELSRVSRAELKHEPVDLTMLAEWIGAELQEAEPGRSATLAVAPDLQALGDERLLKQMLAQLLHNAWKFSGERVRIQVDGERSGDRLRLRIRDHGPGFDMRYADKLFEPFQRLHGPEQGGGNGIGLVIAQRIAERHGGRIRAQSETGAGSTFHVELPAVPIAES